MSENVEANQCHCAQTLYTIDIFNLNIKSIRNKEDALISLVSDFDILCFTETHLDANISNHVLSFDGFDTTFRKIRIFWGRSTCLCFKYYYCLLSFHIIPYSWVCLINTCLWIHV